MVCSSLGLLLVLLVHMGLFIGVLDCACLQGLATRTSNNQVDTRTPTRTPTQAASELTIAHERLRQLVCMRVEHYVKYAGQAV